MSSRLPTMKSTRESCSAVFRVMSSQFLSRSCFRKLNDDLDVLRLPLGGALERLRWFAPRDETRKPRAIRIGQCLSRPVPVTLVGVDAADDDVVLQHRRCGDVG